jgi:hypothetical protein
VSALKRLKLPYFRLSEPKNRAGYRVLACFSVIPRIGLILGKRQDFSPFLAPFQDPKKGLKTVAFAMNFASNLPKLAIA